MIINKSQKIIFCAHGSNSNLFIKEFEAFFIKASKYFKSQNCYKCFIEKNYPDISTCLSSLYLNNQIINFVPILIFPGNHYLIDVKSEVKKYEKIHIHKTINLDKEVRKIFEEKISQEIKSKRRILITACSKSSRKSVYNTLEEYTKKLSKSLKCNCQFSIDNTEIDFVLRKLINLSEREKTELILHPIFLFDGFLYQSILGHFKKLNFQNITITRPFLRERKILEFVFKKISQNLI